MFQQATTSTTTDSSRSLIDRVLDLRRELGIDIPLSTSDPEDTFLSPIGHELSTEMLKHTPRTYDSRNWLAWSQSPGGGNPPEKD